MADWSGQLRETGNARGVWMRSSGLGMVEELPSLPGDLDDIPLFPTSVEEDTEVTDLTPGPRNLARALKAAQPAQSRAAQASRGRAAAPTPLDPLLRPAALANRPPVTLPPAPARIQQAAAARFARPAPQALYDEAPDPAEKTPPTFDMGMQPNPWDEADITEEGEVRPRFAPAADPASAVFDASQADESGSVIQPLRRISAQQAAEREASASLELDDDWLDDELELPAPEPLPLPSPAPSPRLADRAPAPGRASLAARAPAPARPAALRPASLRAAPHPSAFDARADTAPLARPPLTVGTSAGSSRSVQAAWWLAGAAAGMVGASAIAALSFTAALLV